MTVYPYISDDETIEKGPWVLFTPGNAKINDKRRM